MPWLDWIVLAEGAMRLARFPCNVRAVQQQLFRLMSAFALSSVVVAPFTPATAGAQLQQSCAALAHLVLPDTTIRLAEDVAGPTFTPPGSTAIKDLPPF